MTDWLNFFIDMEGMNWLQVVVAGVTAYLFVLWAALVVWVARDSVGRTQNISLQILAILSVIVLNVFGLVLYLILRPQRTLLERYYEELERKALSEALGASAEDEEDAGKKQEAQHKKHGGEKKETHKEKEPAKEHGKEKEKEKIKEKN